MQEEETNIIDSSANAAVDVTPEADTSDASSTDDKPTKTLKLNRAEASKEDEAAPEQPQGQANSSDTETASASEDGENQGGGRNRRNRNRRNRREPHVPSENPLSLTELKTKTMQELIDMAVEMGTGKHGPLTKQDIIFALLKAACQEWRRYLRRWCLEILQTASVSSLRATARISAGPTTFMSVPARFVAFNLRTGDTVHGNDPAAQGLRSVFRAAQSQDSELRVAREAKSKILFENLTPIPDETLTLEKGNGSEDLRDVSSTVCTHGKGQRGSVGGTAQSG